MLGQQDEHLLSATNMNRCATEHANAEMARPRTNASGNLVVTVFLHENLVIIMTSGEALGQDRCSRQCFPGQWACARFPLLSRPQKGHENPPDNATNFVFSGSTKIPQNTRKPAQSEKMF